jgi:hypothetical protein
MVIYLIQATINGQMNKQILQSHPIWKQQSLCISPHSDQNTKLIFVEYEVVLADFILVAVQLLFHFYNLISFSEYFLQKDSVGETEQSSCVCLTHVTCIDE